MALARKCPVCSRPRDPDHAPFCSTRCRDRDLANWLGDGYAIPAEPAHIPTNGEEDDY